MKTRKTIMVGNSTYELSDEFLSHVLKAAAEGGCLYWADVNVDSVGDAAGPDGVRDFDVSDYVEDDGEVHGDESEDAPFYKAASFVVSGNPAQGGTLDLQGIADAIERIASGEVEVAPAIREIIIETVQSDDASDIDAEVADCIVQIGLFDEIVYS